MSRCPLFGLIAMVTVVGGVLVLIFPLFAKPMGWTPSQATHAMGWFVFGLTPMIVGLVTWSAPEPHRPPGGEPVRLRDAAALLMKPDLIRLLLAQLTLTLGPGWMSALYLFYFTQARRFSIGEASGLLLIYMVAGVFGAPITARLAVRFGKHQTLIAAAIAFSVGLCSVVFTPVGNFVATLPVLVWCGFMAAGFDMMIRAMLADVADEVRLEQGRDQISLIYALNSAANKIASALAIGLTFPLLARIGFNATESSANTPAAIHGLELAFIVGPVVFVVLGAGTVLGWKLGPERHAEIRKGLEALDDQQSAANPGVINSEHAFAIPRER